MDRRTKWTLVVLAGAIAVASVADAQSRRMSGRVNVDGSSTVAPITTAAAELFRGEAPRVQVAVGVSGTGGGFKKFLEERHDLRTDINGASRPIKPVELERAKKLGVDFIELPLAYDGIAVVVHPNNDWVDALTVEELKRIWEPGSEIQTWAQVRDGFPDVELKLYGPGTDSGTFDYFVEAIVGRAKACRSDFTPSENDNILVQGVAGDRGALGYFGYSYYQANKARIRAVPIKASADKPAVMPTPTTIRDTSYAPLARPVFVYVRAEAAERPEVQAYLKFLFSNAKRIVEHPRVNYVALSDTLYSAVWKRFEQRTLGSVYADPENKGKTPYEVYGIERKPQ